MNFDINNFRQNHPELIVRDFMNWGVNMTPDTIRLILKYRGVNKWLRVRRLLIQLKSRWREEIKSLERQKEEVRILIGKGICHPKDYHYLKGYCECLKDVRQQIRALCHSPRDIDFPENPKDFGISCDLPINFPTRPHKRWFWKNGKEY